MPAIRKMVPAFYNGSEAGWRYVGRNHFANCYNQIMRQLLTIIGLLLPGLVLAHPVPKLEFDRQIAVEISAAEVIVNYRLEIDQFTLFQEVGRANSPYAIDMSQKLTREDFARAMQARLLKTVPDGLFARMNGASLKWTLVKDRVEFLDSVQFYFRFSARLGDLSEPHVFQLEELNFPDKNGKLKLTLEPPVEGKVIAFTEPIERQVLAGENRKNLIRIEYELSERRVEKPVAVDPIVESKPEEGDNLIERMRRHGLPALLDSPNGLALLLLMAAIFGAAHALTPGHGKTLVAAYLVGEQGTKFHAILLGIITTISHTGSVILIALTLWVFYPDTAPDSVRVLLSFIGGLLIAGLGLWLLMQRLAGKADHVHLPGIGHSHSHGGEVQSRVHGKATMGRLLLLGITGGLIPCWDAVLLLGVAISMQKVWLAIPLLFAFSAGLAAVLVAIGLGVVYAGQKLGGRWAESRLAHFLPIFSSILVILIGIWLCKSAFSPAD